MDAIREFFRQKDKRGHMAVMALVTVVGTMLVYGTAHPVLYAALIAFAVGIGKEIYDRTRVANKFSAADLVADLIGIAVGAGAASILIRL